MTAPFLPWCDRCGAHGCLPRSWWQRLFHPH
jgi:hypothetical protein